VGVRQDRLVQVGVLSFAYRLEVVLYPLEIQEEGHRVLQEIQVRQEGPEASSFQVVVHQGLSGVLLHDLQLQVLIRVLLLNHVQQHGQFQDLQLPLLFCFVLPLVAAALPLTWIR